MKILISTDIEGVAGVFHPDQVRPGQPGYERACRWMTDEASAAVAGAFDGGAREVYVNDSHATCRNLLADVLDPRAQLIQGKPRTLGMLTGVDDGVNGVCLIGYHSRAKGRGILAHTINSQAFARISINGWEMGEAEIYASLAGSYGVPVIAASGDDAFIEEARPLLSGTTWIETKRCLNARSGISLSPHDSCAAIRNGVMQAVRALQGDAAHGAKPLVIEGDVVVELLTQTPEHADLFCQWPHLTRTDGDRLCFKTDGIESAVRILNCLSAMSAALR